MALSKKHYEQFAYDFSNAVNAVVSDRASGAISQPAANAAVDALRALAVTLCVSFKYDNAAFDRARFLKACGF